MSWYTLEDAVSRGPSEMAWMHRVLAGEVSSYVDAHERRWVWIEEVQPRVSGREVEEAVLPLGREISSLRRELKGLREKVARRREEIARSAEFVRRAAPPAPPPAPRPAPASEPAPAIAFAAPSPTPQPASEPASAPRLAHGVRATASLPAALAESRTHEQILELMKRRWSGSDRELERDAGLPKAFLAKAKKGLRSGPRSAPSWSRLEAFLRAA